MPENRNVLTLGDVQEAQLFLNALEGQGVDFSRLALVAREDGLGFVLRLVYTGPDEEYEGFMEFFARAQVLAEQKLMREGL